MKITLLVLLACFLQTVNAATYYFSSNTGDDSRSLAEAGDSSTPWRSLGKLNSFFTSLQPGDRVLLKRGETFFGSIIVSKSGTPGAPIFIGAYSSGNKPVITSLVPLSNWVSKGNGIWESYNSSLSSQVSIVTLDGNEQEMGRYPNSDAANKGYLTFESHSGTTSITDNNLSSSPNWTGAGMVIRIRRWVIDRDVITNHSGNKITYTKSSNYEPKDGYGYFIENSIKTLDKFGEWYFDGSAKKLSVYFGSEDPSFHIIQAASKDNIIFSQKFSNIVFDNLNITGANASGVYIKYGSNISIENCDIQNSGHSGVEATFHPNFKIENSIISNSNYSGVYLGYTGESAVIRNNKITNTSMFSGMGEGGDNKGVGIFTYGNNSTVENNEIVNTGYTGILFNGNNVIIKNNVVDSFCITKDDGAGIYSYTGMENTIHTGRKVIGNIILNGISISEGVHSDGSKPAEGIYLDIGTSGVEIANNTIANCSNQGIYLHCAHDIVISNNTIFNNNRQLSLVQLADHPKVRNCIITGNIFFSNSALQKLVYTSSNTNDVTSFGKFTGNYYARPSDSKNSDFLAKIRLLEPAASLRTFVDPVRFEYNAANQSETVELDGAYTDIKGKAYSGSLTLQPFTSIVLIKSSSSPASSPAAVKMSVTPSGLRAINNIIAAPVKEESLLTDFKLYPNPAINTIKVYFNNLQINKKADLSIQSLSGILLKRIPLILKTTSVDVDINSLPAGAYILRLTGDNLNVNKKFIKIN